MSRSFTYKLLVFSGLAVLTCLLADGIFKSLVLSQSQLERKEKQFENKKGSVKILFMGDSHVQRGIDPSKFEAAFNYSSNGESYLQTYFKLKKALEEGVPMLEWVMLPLDGHSLSSFRTDRVVDEAYWSKFIPMFSLAREDNSWSWLRKGLVGRFASFTGKSESLLDFARGNIGADRTELINGFAPGNGSIANQKDWKSKTKKRSDAYFNGQTLIDPILIDYLLKTYNMCSNRGIRVAFIRYPVSKEFKEHRAYPSISKLESELKKAGLESRINALDYETIFSNEELYFLDGDHLNSEGASRLSQQIAKDILTF